jgi:hypothetical protein
MRQGFQPLADCRTRGRSNYGTIELWDSRTIGLSDFPEVRQGINSLANSKSRLKLTSCTNVNKGIFRGGGRVYLTCLQALKLLANPPLRLIANGARSQLKPTEILILSRLYFPTHLLIEL